MNNGRVLRMFKELGLLAFALALPLAPAGCGLISVQGGEDQIVRSGQEVILTGSADFSASSTGGRFSWMQLTGPTVALQGAASPSASFVAPAVDAPQTLMFEVTASSRVGSTAIFSQDVVVVRIEPAPQPTVSAGEDVVVVSASTIELQGEGDSGAPEAAELEWEQIGGPAVELSDAHAKRPVFTAPVVEQTVELVFELTVTGLAGKKGADTVSVIVEPSRPTAQAGPDQLAFSGQTVTLDPVGSFDATGAELLFLWEQINGPPVELLATATVARFEVPEFAGQEVLTFELIVVAEPQLTSNSDIIEVVVQPYPAPRASAGEDLVVEEGATVVLDGSASTDEGGAALEYNWLGSGGLALSAQASSRPAFVAPQVDGPEAFTLSLTVTNVKGQEDTDTLIVTVIDR